MKTYKNLKELDGNTLEYGDKICFTVSPDTAYDYTVTSSYLQCKGFYNNTIFKALNKLDKSKEICHKAYGYEPHDGVFPASDEGDYEALTRVTRALFKEIQEYNMSFMKEEKDADFVDEDSLKRTKYYDLQPGDKVVLKSNLKQGYYACTGKPLYLNDEMEYFKGETITIKEIIQPERNLFYIEEHNWAWCPSMCTKESVSEAISSHKEEKTIVLEDKIEVKDSHAICKSLLYNIPYEEEIRLNPIKKEVKHI